MSRSFEHADALGPEKVIEIYDASTGLQAVLVVDNVAAGPAIGGVRMAADVTTEECFRLARAMTLKNAMAGLAHGGGKSVIVGDSAMAAGRKQELIRSFAYAIKDIPDYIPGPDMGTDEAAMAHVKDITGRSVGLPREVGGIPLDKIGATGLGLTAALEAAQEFSPLVIRDARVVVQGFGSVGQHAARFLAARGARLIGVSDSRGARVCGDGFDIEALVAHKQEGGSVVDIGAGEAIPADDLIAVACDVWIPAARPDVINDGNVDRLNTKVVAQGANIPATPKAEVRLAERNILVLPDFVANAGGVICAAVEFHDGSEGQALATIEEKITANTRAVLARAAARRQLPREVALEIATERVKAAMAFRKTC